MKHLYSTAALLLITLCSFAQYTQNFNSLVSTGTGAYETLPEGWGIYEIGSSSAIDGKYAVNNGSNNAGNTYSYGTTNSTDRALGSIASNTARGSFGVILFNETDDVINTINFSYVGEQWRYGGNSTTVARNTQDSLRFSYSLNAEGLKDSTAWTWLTLPSANFKSPKYNILAINVVLDGNDPANREQINVTLENLNLQPGKSIILRWTDINIAFNDDALAIDDFVLNTPGLLPGVLISGSDLTGSGSSGGGGTTTNTGTFNYFFPHIVATDSSFLHLYGNLHGHSTHSDGRPSTLEPADDYAYARTVNGMDFLGISEHNHSTAGMQIADYKKGSAQADAANGQLNKDGNPFIALHGMEWGTISGGGHVLVYGFDDKLINWEEGNYDIFVAKSDYLALFDTVRKNPNAVAMLAHPNNSDFTGLTGGYKGVADSAVVSVAIESGPAFSTATNYSDYPTSLAYQNYYRNLLKRGYRVGAHMDQDNHEMTFGSVNGNRIVVLSKNRTREDLIRSMQSMRIYASNDYNASVNFNVNNYIMGSSIRAYEPLTITVNHTDADGEAISAIQLWGGKVGGADATAIETSITNIYYTTDVPVGETWYYYAIITQADGNKIVTSPIWYTKLNVLPVTWSKFTGMLQSNSVLLNWSTAAEVNNSHFIVERSTDLQQFTAIGKVAAKDRASDYTFTDGAPAIGNNFYRLKQVDADGKISYSKVVTVKYVKNFITLSPNPSKGLVKLQTGMTNGKPVLVHVIDAAGNLVYNKMHTGGVIELDLTALPNGFYVVRAGDQLSQMVIAK
jgi:hypothetical protein